MPASGVSDAGSALSVLPSGATSGRARGRAEGTTTCASCLPPRAAGELPVRGALRARRRGELGLGGGPWFVCVCYGPTGRGVCVLRVDGTWHADGAR
eukprot:1394650-Prymnesium_polylepis.1